MTDVHTKTGGTRNVLFTTLEVGKKIIDIFFSFFLIVSLLQNTSLTDGDPMPNSPGSMVNQYRLDEDDAGHHLGVRDLFITVDKPESHVTAIETFITYRVVTKVGTSLHS